MSRARSTGEGTERTEAERQERERAEREERERQERVEKRERLVVRAGYRGARGVCGTMASTRARGSGVPRPYKCSLAKKMMNKISCTYL